MSAERVELPESPVADLGTDSSGGWEIRKRRVEAGGTIDVVSERAALFTGRRARVALVREPFEITELRAPGGGVIMSDQPEELEAAERLVSGVSGDVLVGGLGLGILVWLLQRAGRCSSITVVEREASVISMVAPTLPRGPAPVHIEKADILRFLRKMPGWRYKYALLDTWSGTGEMEWCESVVPLRRALAGRPARDIRCWAEDVMIGQVGLTLAAVTVARKHGIREGIEGRLPSAAFLDGVRLCKPGGPTWQARAITFTRRVGTLEWEGLFGRAWDGAKENT